MGHKPSILRLLPYNSFDTRSYFSEKVCRIISTGLSFSTLQLCPPCSEIQEAELVIHTKRLSHPLVSGCLWPLRGIDKRWEGEGGQGIYSARSYPGELMVGQGSCPRPSPSCSYPWGLVTTPHLLLQPRGGNGSLLFLVPGTHYHLPLLSLHCCFPEPYEQLFHPSLLTT